ncbi:hypothetical protein NUU61_005678 [Penicillium alfredii]|uniref:F-box domain-containing protein n=1 Tax=Penicillium alfredii TaxID=1506179 RepID=A0A9W9FAC9_9EURO|nr:uncharacterized protein NUU61_005678 [Penicillium alfredii]KAJ5096322.1 hypothetical protein NUU61_005678 [Penicillium alfredii]
MTGVSSAKVSKLQQQGQRSYRKGDFKAAIEAFGQALNQQDVDIIGILDNRAAAYSKLGQHDQARRDARQMIKRSRAQRVPLPDERGYLRCAKVLLLEGKPEKALELYAYGLKTLPKDHPRRELLSQLHLKLQDNMNKSLADPMTVLPLELIVYILEYLEFSELVVLFRVSRSWAAVLMSLPNLFMHLDLSRARRNVPTSAILKYIKGSRTQLTHATIMKLFPGDKIRILDMLGRFHDSRQLKSLIISSEIPTSTEYFARFLAALPQLERIAIYGIRSSAWAAIFQSGWPRTLPNLKTIALQSGHTAIPNSHAHPLDLLNLLSEREQHTYPNLEELVLSWCPERYMPYVFKPVSPSLSARLPPLRRIDFRGVTPGPNFLSVLPSTLEELHVQGGGSISPFLEIDATKTLPNLTSLVLKDLRWLDWQVFWALAVNSKAPLRALQIDACFNVNVGLFPRTMDEMVTVNPDLKSLNHLSLVNMPDVTTDYVGELIEGFTKLKILDLSHTKITGFLVRVLADRRTDPNWNGAILEHVVVRGCESVSSDVVPYAEARGLHVYR